MSSLGSYYDVPAGLGGVRVLSGLGCGCQKKNPTDGLGAVVEFVKSPLGIGLLLTTVVVGYILIREAR